jgi:5-methylcytosine-specific restriction endonuclease McrA
MRAVAARRRGFELIHTAAEWAALKKKYGPNCLACGKRRKLTRDHIVPIKLGGTDHISNIQPLCRSCNSSKGTKIVDYRPHT